jgi:plasmid stabilization system protein ParE
MARLIWSEPALLDLDEIAEYIAIDNPAAAARYVQKVFDVVERLELHPRSGKRPAELPRTPYRELVVAPSRIFYRIDQDQVHILHVMRSEQLLRPYLINLRDSEE